MGLNDTPSADRVRIGFFGRRNAGKSSLVNAVTGQDAAVVSPTPGTTTDLVSKAMELPTLGPVSLIDTPGADDVGDLGRLRLERTERALRSVDAAVLAIDATVGETADDARLKARFEKDGLPFLVVRTHADRCEERLDGALYVSAVTGEGVDRLKEALCALPVRDAASRPIVRDLLSPGDAVVFVTPIDASAPKGRLILAQQQAIRDALEADAIAVVTKETTLAESLARLARPPRLVVTDSQAFALVSSLVPDETPLTSFSILLARAKGDLRAAVEGARRLRTLRTGDRVLIAEGCTHHRGCDDIGSVKLPRLIRVACRAEPDFRFASGTDFPDDPSAYALIVHCGACTLNARETRRRWRLAIDAGVPITNYGVAIAASLGILDRALRPFDL